jgi:DNA-binding response OmpR family regulator
MGNKILVVDDIKYLRDSIVFYLQSEGFTTLEAEVGQEGLQVALNEKPDIIISNIEMPVMGGFEMAEKLKKNNLNIPVLFITAIPSQEVIDKARQLGAGYFEKPVNLDEVIKKFKAILSP